MKFKEEFSNRALIQKGLVEIERIATRPWSIMEICGGQTHAFMQFGLTQMLPESINLIHGPGCPVCVTSLELVDKAIANCR